MWWSSPRRSLVAVVGLALFAGGCGSSDDAPQQGDNPIAANAKSSSDMGDRASARTQSAPRRSGSKLTPVGE